MTPAPKDLVQPVILNAVALNLNANAQGQMSAEVHAHAPQATHLQIHATGVVHVHGKPRGYPLLEKLKAKQMIEWEIRERSMSTTLL